MIARLNAALSDRYRIEGELGEGGMATVYLAHDLKHERKVAIKVLKPELAAVVGAERFLAEIKTTANLQHPHILPLYDSGEADGFLYYVMPYVEGETLRDRLDREKQLAVDEAVSFTRKVADALDYAHERGVIHRDIKPANILLSERGEPLVADFGIALAVTQAGGGRITETGLSLGSPHYMSPEQATGDQDVDPRSDVYALGCVLYEMLAGQSPFAAPTAQAVLARILTEEPRDVQELRRSVPEHVAAVIARALEKLPADRFQSAASLKASLDDPAFRHGRTKGVGRETGPGAAYWKRLAIAFGSLAAALAAVVGWTMLKSPTPQQPIRTHLDLTPSLTDALAMPNLMALSDDGSFLVYTGGDTGGLGLWLRRLGDLESTFVGGTELGHSPAISPDGREIAFAYLGDGTVRVVPLGGGASRVLAESASCCVHWGADGFVYFSSATGSLMRVPDSGGTPEALVEDPRRFAYAPALTNDGQVVLFGSAPLDLTSSELRALRLATGEVTTLSSTMNFGRQLPSGDVVGLDGRGRLLVAPFDATTLELSDGPITVADGLAASPPHLAASHSGALVYITAGSGPARYQPVWVDRSGGVAAVDPDWFVNPVSYGNNAGFSISPDGSRVAMGVAIETDPGDIYVKQLPAGPFSRLTSDPGEQARPRWTPDGRRITYISSARGTGTFQLMGRRSDGIGDAELLAASSGNVMEGVLTRDGWRILRLGNAVMEGDVNLGAMAPGEDTVSVEIASEFQETALAVSPDGGWLAYESDETGRKEVYVRSFPDLTLRREQISTAGGMQPVWGRTGRELFFLNRDREMVAVDVSLDDGLRIGDRKTLFAVPDEILLLEQDFHAMYDVDVDDQRFMMLRAVEEADAGKVVLLLDWFGEFEDRLRN